MKKLFSSNQQSPHVGKTFQVGRHHLTVEDVIAEGKYHKFLIFLQRGVSRVMNTEFLMRTET